MKRDTAKLIRKANEVLTVLQKDGAICPADYAVVLGLVANKITEACVSYGKDRQMVVDDLCKAVRIMCK